MKIRGTLDSNGAPAFVVNAETHEDVSFVDGFLGYREKNAVVLHLRGDGRKVGPGVPPNATFSFAWIPRKDTPSKLPPEAAEIQAQKKVAGIVGGKTVNLSGHDSFSMDVQIPPLKNPEVEVLVEILHLQNDDGAVVDEAFRAYVADREIRVGDVTVKLRQVSTVGDTREEAAKKIARLVGIAVAQAYLRLVASDAYQEQEAARSMRIGS